MTKHRQFPILYGRRITNSQEFINVQAAVMTDLLAGKISVKEAKAVNRDSRKILKMFKAVERRKMTATIESTETDIFVVYDGVRIAKRGHPGTAQAKTWISLEPGWEVYSSADHSEITIIRDGVTLQ